MVSEKLMINSDEARLDAAKRAAEAFGREMALSGRNTLRLTLLAEETLGMVSTLLEDFYGQLWFVAEGQRFELHLQATADMDADKKSELLSVSSTGKNAAAKGFMRMLGEVISGALHGFGQVIDAYGRETSRYGIVHTDTGAGFSTDGLVPIWTLETYREELDRARAKSLEAEEAWDELEKSIVASLADDVVVGVKGDRIEMVIAKDFSH